MFRSFRNTALVGAAAILATNACLPVPFVLPPAVVSVGAGLPAGRVVKPKPRTPDEPIAPKVVYVFRAAVHPLQLFPEWFDRIWDVGGGYVMEGIQPRAGLLIYTHGAFVEGSWVAWSNGFLRLHVTGAVELITSNADNGIGGGGTVQTSIELYGFAGEPFVSGLARTENRYDYERDPYEARPNVDDQTDDTWVIGMLYGESAIGLFAGFSFRHLAGETYYYATVGVRARLPASVGIVLVPVWALLDISDWLD